MKPRLLVPIVALMLAAPAYADCAGDLCGSLQKILAARSGNFAKLKGKPAIDPRGDPVWDGTQPISGLINACYIYKRGEGSRYEYRCDSSGFGTLTSQSPEKGKQIAASVKAAFQAADPTLVWFEDPASRALADIEGFAAPRAGTAATRKTSPWLQGSRLSSPTPPAMQPSSQYSPSRCRGAI
jgi:hypothetical protein